MRRLLQPKFLAAVTRRFAVRPIRKCQAVPFGGLLTLDALAAFSLHLLIVPLFLLFAVCFDLLIEIRNILFQHFTKGIQADGNLCDYEFDVDFPKRELPFAGVRFGNKLDALGLFEITESLFGLLHKINY